MSQDAFISGIQQIGVGCENFTESWKWYIDKFGMDVRILEDNTVAERMLPYTGGQPHRRHACIAVNLQGGGGFEIWQYSERKPVPAAFDVQLGDLGVFAAKIKSRDVKAFHEQLKSKKDESWQLSEIASSPDGILSFVVRDPWKNLFYVEQREDIFIEQHKLNGGIVGAMVGCSDIERSISLYRDVLGYDSVVYDKTDVFEDLLPMSVAPRKCRRVKLASSRPREGAFVPLLGPSTIELVQLLDASPRKIFENRYWGDPGFIQICFDVTGMRTLEKQLAKAGYPFTVDSCKDGSQFDMGEASGHFTYIEDADGTLIELVEAHKLTILKRPHMYINMLTRNRRKAFPKLFFRLMGLSKVKL